MLFVENVWVREQILLSPPVPEQNVKRVWECRRHTECNLCMHVCENVVCHCGKQVTKPRGHFFECLISLAVTQIQPRWADWSFHSLSLCFILISLSLSLTCCEWILSHTGAGTLGLHLPTNVAWVFRWGFKGMAQLTLC